MPEPKGRRWGDPPWPAVRLAGFVVLSAVLHVAGVRGLGGRPRPPPAVAPRNTEVRVKVLEKPPEPPPEEKKPEPPKIVKLERPRRLARAPEVPPDAPPPPPRPPEAPPPPNEPAPPSHQPPVLIAGMSLSSTSPTGSFAVGVGNTLYGRPNQRATSPAEVKPYKAREYAPAYALTEPAVYLDNVSPAEFRRFYPPEARKAKIEGVVKVKLVVDDDGSVVKVVVLGDPGNGFGPAAAQLARLFRFRPARVNGHVVATDIEFTVRFQMDD